jgi:asparagine synthase (glutamine-hydrolysing)
MCGVGGIAYHAVARRPERLTLEKMARALHHRGPDGTGYYIDGGIGLAHARLSIIDLATGDQPIHNETADVQVVFNGEIFNFVELRAELERAGHCFYTHSDTEVIVHLYEQYGDRFPEYLNGQFAIALWDARRTRLLLVRDRVGVRPLFYRLDHESIAFASEVKALLEAGLIRARLSPQGLAQVFTFWGPIGSASVFEGVQSLQPGEALTFERGEVRRWIYWDWDYSRTRQRLTGSLDEYSSELRTLMIDAVRLQLRADVPVGVYLSGGLDSAVIAALVRKYTVTPLRTFSLSFEDAEFDESRYQQDLVAQLGTEHSVVKCSRSDIAAAFPRAIWHAETPVVRAAPAPMMLLSGLVRDQGFKVVLTGEGADEVFGGYDLFKEARLRRFMARAPHSSVRPKLLSRLYPYLVNSPTSSVGFAQRFFTAGAAESGEPHFAHIPRWTTTRRIGQYFSAELRAVLGDWDPYAAIGALMPPAIRDWPPLGRDQYVEAHTLLSGYLLSSQCDRMAMANSVEGRVPYLDHRVIEFASSLPARYRLMGLQEKFLLRHAMRDLLPASVSQRTKQPYRVPDIDSFVIRGKLVDYAGELLRGERIRDAGYFDAASVGKLVDKCVKGRAIGFGDNMAFVGILSTMLLDEQFIRRPAGIAPSF